MIRPLQLWLARRRCYAAPLTAYLSQPLPSKRQDYREAEFLVVDLEMSALKPGEGELLSIGYVPIRKETIVLREACHLLLKTGNGVGQSATIHGLHDHHLEHGLAPAAALQQWLSDQAGKVLIAHHARLDLLYLEDYCQRLFGGNAPLLHIDTMELEKKRLGRSATPVTRGGLRLDACRQRYNLPRYRAHNALSDAVATAELFLAQASHIAGNNPLNLAKLTC